MDISHIPKRTGKLHRESWRWKHWPLSWPHFRPPSGWRPSAKADWPPDWSCTIIISSSDEDNWSSLIFQSDELNVVGDLAKLKITLFTCPSLVFCSGGHSLCTPNKRPWNKKNRIWHRSEENAGQLTPAFFNDIFALHCWTNKIKLIYSIKFMDLLYLFLFPM